MRIYSFHFLPYIAYGFSSANLVLNQYLSWFVPGCHLNLKVYCYYVEKLPLWSLLEVKPTSSPRYNMKTLYYSTQIESKTGFCIFWPYSWKYPSKSVIYTGRIWIRQKSAKLVASRYGRWSGKALDHHYNCCFFNYDVCSCNINHYLAPPLNLICTEPIFMVQSFALTFPFFSPKLPSMPDIIKYLEYKVSHW